MVRSIQQSTAVILIFVLCTYLYLIEPKKAQAGPGTFTLVANTSASGISGATTGSIDTTGADLIVIGLAVDDGYNGTPTDSKSNTWTQAASSYTQGNVRVRLWYTVPSSTGSGHTFTFSGTPVGSMFVAAFSGAAQSSPLDQQNGANGFGSSLQTGSITPTESNELVVSVYSANAAASPMSVNSGFTETNEIDFGSGDHYGGTMAYLVQTTASGVNPTWSRTGTNGQAATIVSFKNNPAVAVPVQNIITFW